MRTAAQRFVAVGEALGAALVGADVVALDAVAVRVADEDGVADVAGDDVARGGGGATDHVLGGAAEDVHAVEGVAPV